ncbi:MAG TPA: hypothetical protein H9821_04665 [Candidatus Rothia avicola]|uniref:Uncharacterized protein n=1 Tax=Candidatus Rothia avicola TaxID=2840478 RepID=A0A9D1ZR63_9MICC|nr:hypothetical protein [Candidatus Rothia avicola]
MGYYGYSPESERLDYTLDALLMLNHTLMQVNSTKEIQPPDPVPKPGDKKKAEKPVEFEDLDAIFGSISL